MMSKIRLIFYIFLNTIISGLMFLFAFHYVNKIPIEIPLSVRADGSIGGRAPAKSIFIIAVVYLAVYLISFLIFKYYKKIRFKNQKKFLTLDDEYKKPLYSLIKESVFSIIFFLGLILFYIQTTIIRIGLGKLKTFNLVIMGITFVLFLVNTFFYNTMINKMAQKIISISRRGFKNASK